MKNAVADSSIDRGKRLREHGSGGRGVLSVKRGAQFPNQRAHTRALRSISFSVNQGLLRPLQYGWLAFLNLCWCARRHSVLPRVDARIVNSSRALRLCQISARVAACLALCFLLLHVNAIPARAENINQLQPSGPVNDFAGALTPDTRTKLAALATELNDQADAQLDIVTVHTTGDDAVEDFTVNLAEKWGVGYKGKDRGVMILLAVDDH